MPLKAKTKRSVGAECASAFFTRPIGDGAVDPQDGGMCMRMMNAARLGISQRKHKHARPLCTPTAGMLRTRARTRAPERLCRSHQRATLSCG